MNRFILAALLATSPAIARAQIDAQKQSPEVQALSQTVLDLIGQNVSLRTQVIRLQAELQAQKDQASKPSAGPKEPQP